MLLQEGGKLSAKYCGNRWCLVCNSIRTAKLFAAYGPTLRSWEDAHFVTLTIPWIMPFDVERDLRYHFTKVHEQNRLVMADFYEGARQHGVEAPALTELYERVHA